MKTEVKRRNEIEFDLNLFWKYEDKVNASSVFSEKILNLFAVYFQLRYVPKANPAEIQNASIPAENAYPGKPNNNHPLISDAWALIAETHGLRLLPPRI